MQSFAFNPRCTHLSLVKKFRGYERYHSYKGNHRSSSSQGAGAHTTSFPLTTNWTQIGCYAAATGVLLTVAYLGK
jgi:hypothetical protein